MNPGEPFTYNNERWVISMVTPTYFTIESPNGKQWRTLTRTDKDAGTL